MPSKAARTKTMRLVQKNGKANKLISDRGQDTILYTARFANHRSAPTVGRITQRISELTTPVLPNIGSALIRLASRRHEKLVESQRSI